MDGAPVFPSLLPKLTDPLWFSVDKACDDENEVLKLEEEHKNWVKSLSWINPLLSLNILWASVVYS